MQTLVDDGCNPRLRPHRGIEAAPRRGNACAHMYGVREGHGAEIGAMYWF